MEHLFVDAGDLRIHLTQAGQGKPIVMLHDWPQHWYLGRRMIPRLAPHAQVLCPDYEVRLDRRAKSRLRPRDARDADVDLVRLIGRVADCRYTYAALLLERAEHLVDGSRLRAGVQPIQDVAEADRRSLRRMSR